MNAHNAATSVTFSIRFMEAQADTYRWRETSGKTQSYSSNEVASKFGLESEKSQVMSKDGSSIFCPRKSTIDLGPASRGFFNSTIAGKSKRPMDTPEANPKASNNASIIDIGTD